MTIDGRDDSYLVGQLLEFHAELVRIKRGLVAAAAQSALPGAPEVGPEAGAGAVMANVQQLGQVLRNVLDRQSAEAEQLAGRHGREVADAARYLKVALADDALIAMPDWPQRKEWIAHPLEYQLYGMRCAGERIFDRMALLLQEQPPVRLDLAQLYLLALGMGFQGRYRRQEGALAELQGWRRELYRHAYGHAPERAFADMRGDATADLGPRLLPQAYQHIRSGEQVRLLPNPRRWALYFVLLLLAMLLLSQLVWQSGIAPLTEQLAKAGMPAREGGQ